jgi:hypothetical protein
MWGWVALALGLVAAWLFDRRARRDGHKVQADIRKVNDERYSHAGSMDPDLGAPVSLYTRAEEAARRDKDPDAPAERR